ncbi:hypothetical protein [Sporosarcina sp. G11-34]|uniref:hypothetical protein n=1 Tax=Sporosarcina sp. G11-34 TaxID=2849605 RepID=UPI0022A93E33|nr:hypothetical protein [Sporosarcina sp. G11-34]MCZ2260767.1 hypothetical protein [Sporosarcina sp. G11-34]
MKKLPTIQQAKNKILELQAFVSLVEDYDADTLEKRIIKEYAYSGSMVKVTKKLNESVNQINGSPVEKEYVAEVIKGRAGDELHKVVRASYFLKTRHIRG